MIYDRCRPLIDGQVKPEGIDLDITILKPRELFPHMLEEKQEFQILQVSLGSYASLVARDAKSIRRHSCGPCRGSSAISCIYVRTGAGITTQSRGTSKAGARHHAIWRHRNSHHQGHAAG